jgi:cytoskeletal protein CcmA (bactofilin family)
MKQIINHFSILKESKQRISLLIEQDVVIDGDVNSSGTLAVMGHIRGNVCAATVIIQAGGKIDGIIRADKLDSAGIAGDEIIVSDLVLLRKGSISSGQIEYGKILVESGALINAKLVKQSDKVIMRLVHD